MNLNFLNIFFLMVNKFAVLFGLSVAGAYASHTIGRNRFGAAKNAYIGAHYSVQCDVADSCIIGKFNKKDLSNRYVGMLENKPYVPYYAGPEFKLIIADKTAEKIAKDAKLKIIPVRN